MALPLITGCDGCSDESAGTGGSSSSGASPTGSTSTGDGGAGGATGASVTVTASSGGDCPPGTPCEGGTCDENGVCCASESVCGERCCDAGAVCAFLECIVPGATCGDDGECAADEYCDFSLGEAEGPPGAGGAGGGTCPAGVAAPEGKCMPRPPVCADGQDPGDPPTCVTSCEYRPPIGLFSPELKYAWGDPADPTHNVMMAPIVVQLDDDDCDGAITARDIPEIVFFTFDNGDYNNTTGTASTLHAISIVEGVVVEKLSVKTTGESADAPGRSIAGGDIDGDGDNEIVVCTKDGRVRAYEADGTEKWLGEVRACFMPSIADLDQDGLPEIVDQGIVLDGATGVTKATFPTSPYPIVSDVDGDGFLDIVTGSAVYDAAGVAKVTTPLVGTHAAVGDLDLDGIPEIVSVDTQTHTVDVWHVTGPGTYEVIREDLDLNEGIDPNPCCVANPASAGCTRGGGTPTIARFNEDGFPDVGLAGGIGYVVFDGQALMDGSAPEDTRLWLRPTQDCSSAQTGSSVFDFDGDGVAEVVYADETTMHVYAGPTGDPLFETCSTNGTLWEYPLVADVDNDGHADIVVGSNSYSGFTCPDGSKTTGIRVFGDLEGRWVRTRRVWNQHAYHVTNVEESGAIPTVQASNHLQPGLNNFRQNVQPTGQFAAPDLVVSVAPVCTGDYRLRARVLNVGEAPVEEGVLVGFYEGSTRLGEAVTTRTLYPLTFEDLELPLPDPIEGDVHAVVDDGSPPHPWHECRTDNNRSAEVPAACEGGPN